MIYICIPTHDEERTIGVMLWKIRNVMADFQRDYQILVADDASTDETQEVLEPYTRILPLTVFRNPRRRGYAASLEMLLREAVRRSTYPKRDVVVTLQADFTDEPDEIPTLVKRIEGGADIVTSNMGPGLAGAPRAVRWTWRVLRFLLRRMKWPDEVTDPISGFRAYRLFTIKKAVESRPDALLGGWEGWAANAALLRAVAPYARRVEETPVTLRYDRRARPTRFRALDAGRDVVRFIRTAGKNGKGAARAGGAHAELLDATELEVRAAAPLVARPEGARGTGGRDRRAAGSSTGRRARGARNGERKRNEERGASARRDEGRSTDARAAEARPSRSRGGRGRRGGARRREARAEEVLRTAASDAAASDVAPSEAAPRAVAASETAPRDAAPNDAAANAAASNEPASSSVATGSDIATETAAGDASGRAPARRSRGRRSGGGRSRRTGARQEGAPAEGSAEGAAGGEAASAGAAAPSSVAEPATEAASSSPSGDSPAGEATSSSDSAPRRRGRRGGRRGGSGRSAARKNVSGAEGASEVVKESEKPKE